MKKDFKNLYRRRVQPAKQAFSRQEVDLHLSTGTKIVHGHDYQPMSAACAEACLAAITVSGIIQAHQDMHLRSFQRLPTAVAATRDSISTFQSRLQSSMHHHRTFDLDVDFLSSLCRHLSACAGAD